MLLWKEISNYVYMEGLSRMQGWFKSRLQNIIYVSPHTFSNMHGQRLEDYIPLGDFSSSSVLFHIAFFFFHDKHELLSRFPFQNKQKHPLRHTGRESEVKECECSAILVISPARMCPWLLPEMSCRAGMDSSWMPLKAAHARMKIQNLKRADDLCNYIKPYLQ